MIGADLRRCGEVVERSDGFVAKYTGDGVLAFFGYPTRHHWVEHVNYKLSDGGFSGAGRC